MFTDPNGQMVRPGMPMMQPGYFCCVYTFSLILFVFYLSVLQVILLLIIFYLVFSVLLDMCKFGGLVAGNCEC